MRKMNKRALNSIRANLLLSAATILLMFVSNYLYDDILNNLITVTLFGFYLYGWLILDIRYKNEIVNEHI